MTPEEMTRRQVKPRLSVGSENTGLTGNTFRTDNIGTIRDEESALTKRPKNSNQGSMEGSNPNRVTLDGYDDLEYEKPLKQEQESLRSQIRLLRILMVFLIVTLVGLVVGFLAFGQ